MFFLVYGFYLVPILVFTIIVVGVISNIVRYNNQNKNRNQNRSRSQYRGQNRYSRVQGFDRKFKKNFHSMPKDQKKMFLKTLSDEERAAFRSYVYGDMNSDQSFQFAERMMQEQLIIQQFNDFAMQECIKGTLPFDMGGYLLGEGINPSDTMTAQMNNLSNDMNSMNNDMNSMNNMNGMF